MEDCMISSLTDDLLERIFVVLPLWNLFRAMAVCKRWRQIITSQNFMAASALSPPHKPWYCIYNSEGPVGVSYDSTSSKWHQFDLPSFFHPFIQFACAANGLACFLDDTDGDLRICVCNPITKMWRNLEKPITLSRVRDYSSVAMEVDRKNYMYKFVVASSTLEPRPGVFDMMPWKLSVEIYDSISDCWSTSAETRLLEGWRTGSEESIICKGILYCVTHPTSLDTIRYGDLRLGLIAYDLALGKFDDMIILMPYFLSCARLVSWKDKLIMVGGIGTYDKLNIKGVGIWELLNYKEWKQIRNMPMKLFRGFKGCLDNCFECSGQEDVIFIRSNGGPHLMIYDVTSGSWNWARTCPVLERDHSHLEGFCFEPRLNARV